jgi:D-threo-aldose 1-dehydrogenase
MIKIKKRRLGNSDCTITELELGCSSLAGVGSSVNDHNARSTLEAALADGTNYFDTAPFYGYGRSERIVGDALRGYGNNIRLSSKAGRILRPCSDPLSPDDMFPDALPMRPHYDYSYDGIMRSFDDSLQQLPCTSLWHTQRLGV